MNTPVNVVPGKQGFQRRSCSAPAAEVALYRSDGFDDHDEDSPVTVATVTAAMRRRMFTDRLQAHNALLASLNRRRLALSIDSTLPAGVVRCVDCGRFSSERSLGHACPFPALVEAGFDADMARRLAIAGFDTAADIPSWSKMIERHGIETAGLWRATGLPPVDAARSAASGIDPATVYLDLADEADLVDGGDAAGASAIERLAEQRVGLIGRWEGLRTLDERERYLDSLIEHGTLIAAEIDERASARIAAARAEIVDIGREHGLTDEQLQRLAGSTNYDWMYTDGRSGMALTEEMESLRVALEASGEPLSAHERAAIFRALNVDADAARSSLDGLRPEVVEFIGEHRDLYQAGSRLWKAAHEVSAKSREIQMFRAQATAEVLSSLRPFGGDLGAAATPKVREALDAACKLLPSDWLAASQSKGELRVEAVRRGGRASYCHSAPGKVTTRTERSAFQPDRKSFSILRNMYGGIDPTPEQIEQAVRNRYPEAYDAARFVQQGKARGRRALWSARTRNISNIVYDPETRTVSFDCESEKVTQHQTRAERRSVIQTDQSPRTAIHELGHRMENTVPGLQLLATSWRNRRTADLPKTRIAGCGRGEYGYEDGFVTHYVGKVYPTGDTEVISVGLESVLCGTHGGLAGDNGERADPEHRAFMLGVLSTFAARTEAAA